MTQNVLVFVPMTVNSEVKGFHKYKIENQLSFENTQPGA